jgi:hypothetical protein
MELSLPGEGMLESAHCYSTPELNVMWWLLGRLARRPVEWLWPLRVPLGKLTLLVGDPGCGKSLLALDMAARVTRGAGDCQILGLGE